MDRKKSNRRETKQSGHTPHPRSDEVNYEATEPERIRELEREQELQRNDDEFVTDAELEAREIDRDDES
jgi:hypothetical protein